MIPAMLAALWRRLTASSSPDPTIMSAPASQAAAPAVAPAPTNPTNANIAAFLDYYCALTSAPNYAVLIKGPWGSGKTHLVKNFFARRPQLKTLYVSLYGVASAADIESVFFAQLHPVLSSRGMKIAAAVVKGVLKNAKFDVEVFDGAKLGEDGKVADVKLPKFLSDAGERIITFDDLERCKMPIKEVLGYINAFVEHDDSKVILIANEEEILKSTEGNEYRDTKEKLIGKSFSVKADLDSAFQGFVAAVPDSDIRQFFTVKRGEIETIFRQSGSENLRILRQTMLDFDRLAGVMEPAHRRKTEAMGDIMPPYFALSFEMKVGRITAADVTKIGAPDWSRVLGGGADSPQAKTAKRYPEVRFENAILGMKIIRDALFDSALDGPAIKDLIARSKYFLAAKDEPAWKALWYSMNRSEKEAQAALDTVEKQFKQRVFTHQGEILHVAALRLWLSRIGAIATPVADVVKECKAYIDAIYAEKKLDPRNSLSDVSGNPGDAYDGLGFMDRETAEFGEILSHLRAMEQKAEEDQYPAKVQELLGEMATNTDLFTRRLCLTNSKENIYAQVPILLWIKPEDFVARYMALPQEQRRNALIAFAQRYTYLHVAPRLAKELDWLDEVKKRLETEIAKLPAISRHALTGALKRYVEVPLAAARAAAAPAPAAPAVVSVITT